MKDDCIKAEKLEFAKYPLVDLWAIYHSLPKDFLIKLSGKTVVITGGSGFLGSAFRTYLLFVNEFFLKGYFPLIKIVSIDRYTGRDIPIEEVYENVIYYNVDIATYDFEQLDFPVDFIFNCAGNASPKFYSVYSMETIDVSVEGTKKICEFALKKGAKLLNFSSSEVLGTPPDEFVPTDETYVPKVHTMNPRACYDVGKMMLETISWEYKTKKNLDVKVVRLFNCVGRFRQDDFRVFPNFISAALKGEPIQVFGDGEQTRTFSWYSDVIAGCFLVLFNGTEPLYHIGNSDNEITMSKFAYLIEEISGKKGLVKHVEVPENYKFEPLRRCPSIELARKIGYNPTVSVETMIEKVYNWAKDVYVY